MRNQYKAFGYLTAANTEAIALVIAAWYGGEWLNSNYDIGIDWYIVTFPTAVLIIFKSWYRIYTVLTKPPKESLESEQPTGKDDS